MKALRRLSIRRPDSAMLKEIERQAGPDARGRVAAIDVDEGRFFLGDTVLDAARIARRELRDPRRCFFFVRIGVGPVHRHHGAPRRK